jgi:hypothetical protein
MSRRLAMLVAVMTVLGGCGASETKWTAEAAQYAVYATQIPLYPGAEAEDAIGSEMQGEVVTEGMTFWFKVDAPKDQVVAWYEAKLAGATRRTLEEGEIMFTLAPRGGEVGEEMGVIVDHGRFRVFENTKAGKHKES